MHVSLDWPVADGKLYLPTTQFIQDDTADIVVALDQVPAGQTDLLPDEQ
jgi:hypothetical protein